MMVHSVAQLTEDIDRSRMRIGDMLNEIESRLSPATLTNQLFDAAESLISNPDKPGEAPALQALLRDHPVPITLIGVGLVWLGLSLTRNEGRLRQTFMEK